MQATFNHTICINCLFSINIIQQLLSGQITFKKQQHLHMHALLLPSVPDAPLLVSSWKDFRSRTISIAVLISPTLGY